MDAKDLEELKRINTIFSTPLDVDRYISEGVISRYRDTKTKFILHFSKDEIPEEISRRANKLELIQNKDGTSTTVLGLNLKTSK
ncbi:hypothetical protein L4D17_23585 [Vibrio splendidus]|uniref:hypothetical protein n=1 Tax=Vibrio splendidus TaxID=29497 RepID=UPI003D0D2659